MPDLYTVICEYDRGTYIAQVHATLPQRAISSWIDGKNAPQALSKEERQVGALKNETPVRVRGCQNVWCCTGTGIKGLILISLVRTVPRSIHKTE